MAVTAVLNGTDVTSLVMEGSVTHTLNQPGYATIRIPSDQIIADTTSRLKVLIDGVLDFHGICWHIEDQGDENTMSTTFTFADPTVLWDMRPARDGLGSASPGDFSKPSFMNRNTTGPAAIQEILTQSMNGSDQSKGEGSMGITIGTVATGGANLAVQPADWPQTIAQVIAFYVETGEVDVICVPIDQAGNMAQINLYNGNFGQDLSGSVAFQYGLGAYNARGVRRTQDCSSIMNKLWIYLGPRVGTESDPQGNQHWAANITGDDTSLPNPPQSTILAARTNSQTDYFVRMQIRIFDGDAAFAKELYRRWWQMESWMRLKPQTIVAISPQRGIKPSFGIGDKISVAAASNFRGGFSGVQRVMEYTYKWDNEGVFELGEPVGKPGVPAVKTSADNEGIIA